MRAPSRVSLANFSSGYDYYTSPATGELAIDWAQNKSGPAQNVDPSQGSCYSAHDLAAKAAARVAAHDVSRPLFMYFSLQSVHSPYQAPQLYINRYDWMRQANYKPITGNRQTYAGMVEAMDEAVANVTQAFRAKGDAFWERTLYIFTSDNGGDARAGNNWPLRGRKGSLWEGGTRAVGT